MAAYQALPSLGFSRWENWSGLPFPSPVHESEKWKGSHSVMSNSSWPHGLQSTRLLCAWDFPGNSTGVGCHCLLILINNYLKCKWVEWPNQKTKTGWMDTKQGPYICCLQGPTSNLGAHTYYQATNGIFQRTRTNNFIICMDIQKTSNSQCNLEKEEWNWSNQPAWL